jgi:5S rRNA maturation endonuclease (ribonuclease M5)
MDDKEFLEEFWKEVERLKERKTLIIVEGFRDRKALEKVGLKEVKKLSGPLYRFVETLKADEVVILTDLDREGKKLYSVLKNDLQRMGVKVDDRLRNLLFKSQLRQIEGLTGYLERITS